MFNVPIFFLPEITNELRIKINAIKGGLTFYISLSVKLLLQLLFVNIKTKASDLLSFPLPALFGILLFFLWSLTWLAS